jgi:DNA-binding NtrC family response regulator
MLLQRWPQQADTSFVQTILVVDDDASRAEELSGSLRAQGFGIEVAASVAQTLEFVEQRPPAMIILEQRMPETHDGRIWSQLAETSAARHIPVIVLNGMERPDIIRRVRAGTCQYFVRKPYDPQALVLLIRQALSESRSLQHASQVFSGATRC